MATTQTIRSILDAALALPSQDRAEIAQQILHSLHKAEGTREEIDAAWIAEAEARDAAVESGAEQLLDGEEILAKLSRGECP